MPRQKCKKTPSKTASNRHALSQSFNAMDDVYKKPGYLFRRMQQIAVAAFMEECRSIDLTPVQYATLVAIRAHPGSDATRLSALIAFDRSTLGSVIERLEIKKFLERKPGPDDKRVKLLYLTKAGASELRNVEPLVAQAQTRILHPLAPADRNCLLKLLTQLVELNNDVSRVSMRADEGIQHLKRSD
jgi:DNA-binding MarR family transcriptional regulator